MQRVVLRNIKGFGVADLNLAPSGEFRGWTVITGDNGAGKTALLRAICLAILGHEQSRSLAPDLSGWVQQGQDSGSISVEIKPDHALDRTAKGGFPTQSFWAEVEISRENDIWQMGPTDIFKKKKKGAANGPWTEGTPGWLTVGYGPFRRLYGSSPEAQRLMVLPGRIPRFATLFREDATLAECEEWAKSLQFRKLEGTHKEDAKALDDLVSLIRDDFLRHGLSFESVSSDGIKLKDDARRVIPLAEMSEGYRAALAMLIDLYRHFVLAYGVDGLLQVGPTGLQEITQPGVVIIDEIDSHLHPAWQQEIGFWMRSHFPNVQFIVTTHSPLVAAAADANRIFYLPQPSDGLPFQLDELAYRQVIAGRADEVLRSPAFGLRNTRSPRAVRARARHAELGMKSLAGAQLSTDEKTEMEQLELFVYEPDEQSA